MRGRRGIRRFGFQLHEAILAFRDLLVKRLRCIFGAEGAGHSLPPFLVMVGHRVRGEPDRQRCESTTMRFLEHVHRSIPDLRHFIEDLVSFGLRGTVM